MFAEIGAPSKESFRKWLSNVLAVDVDNHTTEDGLQHLRGSGGAVAYRVRNLERAEIVERNSEFRQLIAFRLAAESFNLGLAQTDAGVQDMVAPLILEAVESKSPEHSLLRVTPGRPGEQLDPSIAGTFFHEAMQHFSRKLEPLSRATLVELARGNGIGIVHPIQLEQLLKEVQELLDRFRESALFTLMRTARKRIHEAPYMIVEKTARSTQGRLDLLLQSQTGEWFVIDYKTDHFKIEEIDSRVEKHRDQLSKYVDHIELLTGVRAKPVLYFAQHGLLKEIPE